MTRRMASRIASNLVGEFSREKHFALCLPSREDLKLMAESLIEEQGCQVVWNEEANKIAVRCPECSTIIVQSA